MGESRFVISLRIFSQVTEPSEIIKQIGVEPKWQYRLGDPRMTPDGKPLQGFYEVNYCSFELEHEPDEGLVETLNLLADRMSVYSEFFKNVKKCGGRIEFFVGWFLDGQDGGVFGVELLEKLVRLGTDLLLDVYGDGRPPADNSTFC